MSKPITTIEEALAALGPAPDQEPPHGPLWSLLDWSLWGAGMGDVFREAMADRMVAAIPAEGVAHAEALMAEFIERRQIEKTGVTIYQEQRDELERLRKRVAELEKSSPAGADATPAPDFFQPGRTYAYDATGFTAPELLTVFRVVANTVHPDTGKRMAFGWIRTAEDVAWSPYAEPADEWPTCWTDVTEGGEES